MKSSFLFVLAIMAAAIWAQTNDPHGLPPGTVARPPITADPLGPPTTPPPGEIIIVPDPLGPPTNPPPPFVLDEDPPWIEYQKAASNGYLGTNIPPGSSLSTQGIRFPTNQLFPIKRTISTGTSNAPISVRISPIETVPAHKVVKKPENILVVGFSDQPSDLEIALKVKCREVALQSGYKLLQHTGQPINIDYLAILIEVKSEKQESSKVDEVNLYGMVIYNASKGYESVNIKEFPAVKYTNYTDEKIVTLIATCLADILFDLK